MGRTVTKSATRGQDLCGQIGHNLLARFPYDTGMVTRIRKGTPARIWLAEWMEHKHLDAEQMADRVGIERESFYRWLREPKRINLEKLGDIAFALGLDDPGMLLYPPPPKDTPKRPPSLDKLIAGKPEDVQALAFEVVRRLTGTGQ